MTSVQRISIKTLLVAPIMSALLIAPASSADRSDGHALALSHRYGAYTKKGNNLAAGETVVIDTPEGVDHMHRPREQRIYRDERSGGYSKAP